MQAKNIVPDIAAAMNVIDNTVASVTEQFTEAAQLHYENSSIVTAFFTKIFPRAPFDLDHELRLMSPLETEFDTLEFVSAYYQYEWFMTELANIFNDIGKVGDAFRAGALHVDIDVDLLYKIKMLASGKNYFELL